MQGIILSAGPGRRLQSVTGPLPKALVSMGGHRVVDHLVLLGRRAGRRRFVVVLRPDHLVPVGSQLATFFAPFGVELVPVAQAQPRGPGQALATALPYVHDGAVVVFLGATSVQEDLPWGKDWVAVAEGGWQRGRRPWKPC